ncbi:LacI family DNA-binding transcriptional regulator [Paraburkholderia sediminicola]|uniref:LacI family DNA-binding transcriptional regulator n=1 Tax=Paraburkholderia sediminicola TaxID=458836 RepID=UPI0038BC4168
MKKADDMLDLPKQTQAREDERVRHRRNTGRMTLRDVAEHLGISQISVSRYFQKPERLSGDLRERIGQAVDELGYVPNLVAGGLASATSSVIGMVIPNISGPIFAETIQTFSDAVTARGYQLLLASSYFSETLEENAVRAFLGWSPAALVLTSAHHSAATEEMIARAHIPIIEAWSFQADREPIQIGFSQADVGRLAARHLVERGYRRIAYALTSVAGDLHTLDRRDGYIEVMRELGREPLTFTPNATSPFHAGKQALEALAKCEQPADAIIFANDNLAAGALLAAPGMNISVPGDCAMIGFGGFALSEMMTPGLTSIRPPAGTIGLLAAERIFEVVESETPRQPIARDRRLNKLACELVERESTGWARGKLTP